ncbi:MAG TPA: cytochrome P450 [Streptosporangiaceae bacterium]|nr:cytochrome P450 [Streptosporangiaceae bacterium]
MSQPAVVTVWPREGAVKAARRARARDRRVYLASHPVIFALLAATRGRSVTRIGGTVLVQGTDAFRQVLTRMPLDRTAEGTTGGLAREFIRDGVLFDQDGQAHRDTRRSVSADLSAAGVDRLRPAWRAVLSRRFAPLGHGELVDLTEIASEVAGTTVCGLLGLDTDPLLIARLAADVAAAAARAQLPGLPRPGRAQALAAATGALISAAGSNQPGSSGTASMLAVAAVNTTVAGLPRAVAWCADGGLWPDAASADRRDLLASELLRVTAPTALLPRVAAATGTVEGVSIRPGDRLMLVARHAARAHRNPPDCDRPAPAQVAQLVFGAGSHACPGAALARAQLADTLELLAPFRPRVVRARADRRSALPGWRSLLIQATT